MMNRRQLIVTALVVFGVASAVQTASAADPTGTWKWSTTFNNQTRERTLKLKLEGDKLTGSIPGRDNQERAIENATFKDDEVTFETTRERNGQKRTTKYKAKLNGDVLKGTIEFTDREGKTQSRDWEAKRSA
ncbi:MAG: hypothetical protein ACKVT0_01675 [Planctomycetaceae bacterium]